MESSFTRMLDDTVNQMRILIATSRESGGSAAREERRGEEQRFHRDTRGDNNDPFAGNQVQDQARRVKLDFPRFNNGDPEEWLNKAKQYFAYHDIPSDQKVGFASYHLTAEANAWWQAKLRGRGFDIRRFPWEAFEAEMWTRFGPSDGEDFEEALCHIRQKGTLMDYQREFERLQNKVEWSEKTLVGAFMGGLHISISSGIRILKPRTLADAFNLARMRDDQLQQEKRWRTYANDSATPAKPSPTPRRLNWDEIKKKRSLGLCFSCDERYIPGHKCTKPQVFVMEGAEDVESEEEETLKTITTPKITLHDSHD